MTQAALLPVSPVSLAVVLTVLVRLPLVTSAALVACSLPPRSGGSGTRRSTLARSKHSTMMCKYRILMNRRFATASALAASSVPSLLFARGHRVGNIPEVPLVVDSKTFEKAGLTKTKAAIALLQALGAGPELQKVQKSRKMRAGKGKLRNRRFRQRRGPLVVYNPDVDGKELVRAFRNIPGVETTSVYALNLLQLAPGGHLGRFIVWTSAAFKALDQVYGTTSTPAALKKDYLLPSNVVSNADLSRLINSSEIQSVLRAPKGDARTKRSSVQKKNPLRNRQVMLRLNPYAAAFSKEKLGQKGVQHGKPERAGETFQKILHED